MRRHGTRKCIGIMFYDSYERSRGNKDKDAFSPSSLVNTVLFRSVTLARTEVVRLVFPLPTPGTPPRSVRRLTRYAYADPFCISHPERGGNKAVARQIYSSENYIHGPSSPSLPGGLLHWQFRSIGHSPSPQIDSSTELALTWT